MDKTDKAETPASCFRAHCFPVLGEANRTNVAEEVSTPDQFQPLYKDRQADSAYKPSGIRSLNQDGEQQADAAERRQSSYERGIKAGENDAHCLLQEEIAPSLQEFKLAADQFNAQLGSVTRSSSQHAIQLAMEIVRKILGDGPGLDDQHFSSVHQSILDAMVSSYGIRLRLNAEDLENLNAMLNCDSSLALKGEGVRLAGDDGLEKGTLNHDPGDRKLAVEPIEQMLAQLLDNFRPS